MVDWWQADSQRAEETAARRREGRRSSRRQRQQDELQAALQLIEDGEISRGLRRLHSLGVAGLTEGVLAQMRAKHPERSRPVPADLPLPAAPAYQVHLTEIFRQLRRRAAPGRSGLRNEFLRALVGQFDDALADRVMPEYDAFATSAVALALPSWFYSAWAIAGLTPLIKCELDEGQAARGEDPDARPIAVGEASLRAILRGERRPGGRPRGVGGVRVWGSF